MIRNVLLVALGGAFGSVIRYAASLFIHTRYFPWPTLAVNIIGSFIIGLVLACSIREESFLYNWKLFLATGVCGGFTTFSAFSLENMEFLQSGKYVYMIFYITASIVFGIAAAWGGFRLVQ